jgi:N-acetylmuramoyl-L-alanine amidase
VLELAQALADGIDIPGVSHRLLRTANDGAWCPGYVERAEAALKAEAQLVLCHHVNSYADASAHGLITFYDAGDELGALVAGEIARSAPKPLRRARDAVFVASPADWTAASHWVIDHYRSLGISAVLIEWGFSSNPGDAAALLAPATRPDMVTCAAAGVARAFEFIAKRVA